MRLIDADVLGKYKFHHLPYTYVIPSDAESESYVRGWNDAIDSIIESVPDTVASRDVAKRVLWTGWKGFRDTRYKCPGCNKPVRNDDSYCHRCGQKLLFPKISFTQYVEGQKQETIVRWDDEE